MEFPVNNPTNHNKATKTTQVDELNDFDEI